MNKFTNLMSTLLLLCGLLVSINLRAQSLGLKVAGIEITKENAGDIISAIGMGEGNMWYDYATHTLTLDNVTLDTDRKNVIESSNELKDFTICLIGNNVLVQKGAARMMLRASKNTITGKGTLDVSSPWTQGIFVDMCDLEINGGCTVIAHGSWGICSDSNMGKLTINASKVVAEGEFGSICDFEEIELIDCAITSPAESYVDGGAITDDWGDTRCDQVVIEKISSSYDLTIGGVKVDDTNAEDIFGDETAEYNPDTKTLFLRGAHIESVGEPAVSCSSDIIIDLMGINKISSDMNAMIFGGSVMVRGKGMLNINSSDNTAVEVGGDFEIFRTGDITINGKKGIIGINNPVLKVTESKVNIKGSEMSLGGFGDVVLDGCQIFEPENCVIKNGTAYVGEDICTENILIDNITVYDLYVGGEPVTSLNYKDFYGDGTVCVDIDNNIITLNNFKYVTTDASAGIAVQSGMGNTTIVLKGDNVISTPYFGVICSSDVVFEGDGTLDVEGTSSGMVIQSTVTMTEGPKISVRGDMGITCLSDEELYGVLVLDGASLSVEGSSLGSITKLSDLQLKNCEIVSPEGAEFVDGSIMLNGEICKQQIDFEKIATNINSNKTKEIKISSVNGKLNISNINNATDTYVYDMAGRVVYNGIISNDTNIALQSGSYIVVVGEKRTKVLVL